MRTVSLTSVGQRAHAVLSARLGSARLVSLTMSAGRMLEAAMTMALGGVATGSMKAYEQHSVAGIMKYSGWMCMAEA